MTFGVYRPQMGVANGMRVLCSDQTLQVPMALFVKWSIHHVSLWEFTGNIFFLLFLALSNESISEGFWTCSWKCKNQLWFYDQLNPKEPSILVAPRRQKIEQQNPTRILKTCFCIFWVAKLLYFCFGVFHLWSSSIQPLQEQRRVGEQNGRQVAKGRFSVAVARWINRFTKGFSIVNEHLREFKQI
jgi:hypothetical protein